MTNSLNCHALALKEGTTLTISSGVVTALQEYHIIAAETGTTDDLDTISLGYTNLSVKGNTYRPCLRLIADAGDTITLKHGTGNLTLPDDTDITLSDDAFVWLLWRGSAWYAMGTVGGGGATTADNVTMDVLGTPTYTTVQDWSDTTQSAGLISGGAITDNGDGTVAAASGTGIIKSTDSNVGNSLFFDFSADASVTLTDESDNWVYVDYNGGTPIIDAAADWTTLDLHTQMIIGKVYREGTEVHIVPVAQNIDDFSRRVMQRLWEKERVTRVDGLVLADAGTLHFAFTAGTLYAALARLAISAFDTTGADRFTYMYRDGLGDWTEVAAQEVIDNANWDDGTGVLNTLTALRYGVHWVYVAHDGDVYVQYGQGDYILAQALAALVPDPPPELTAIATLAGKIIAQQGGTELYSVQSAFTQTFEGVTATDHGSLAGLADDDHTQYALLAGRSGGQTLIGGTDASDDLTLQTTSDGTKGDYILSELTTAGPVLTSAAGVLSSEAQLALERGGTESDLSATGPGFLRQSASASPIDVAIATPYNYRSGLQLIKQADDEIVVGAGSCVVQNSLGYPLAVVNTASSTRLALGTASNWVSGSVDEAASSWISVYVRETGAIKLHNQLPNEIRAAAGASLYLARVNEAGWDGTAGQGLNATTVTYDDGAGGDPAAEGSFQVGMWVSVWTDSGYTTGRGKGSGAAGSVNNLSVAKVTAVDTGANTITLEAGHQIALNDNDYLTLFYPGVLAYRYVGTTHWLWLGAIYNDASSNLTTNNDHSAQYTLDEGADLSTTSTSFVDADATNLALPIISLGNDIIAKFDATVGASANSARVRLNLSVDEADIVGDDGVVSAICPTATRPVACPINRVLHTLMPGTHLVKVRLRAQTGTAYIWAGAGTGNECDVHGQFSVREVR
jgi:hypothetical protein